MNQLSAFQPVVGMQPYRVSAASYLHMIEAGVFGDAHVELVDGALIEMAASNTGHGRLLMQVGRLLGSVYAEPDFVIYGDIITKFDDSNVRAPDIAVVDQDIGDRNYLFPGDILLAVEISHSTLSEDLGRKRIDYATSGIRNYWVVDVDGRRTHCYTDPQGADYAAIRVVAFGDPLPVPGTAETFVVL